MFILLLAGAFAGFYFFVLNPTNKEVNTPIELTPTPDQIFPENPISESPTQVAPSPETPLATPTIIVDSETGPAGSEGLPTGEVVVDSIGTVRKISESPVAGATSFYDSKRKLEVIRFIEKERGNLFDAQTENTVLDRISIDTIPRIQEAFFTNNGSGVVLRYLKDLNTIETYGGALLLSKASTSKGFYELEGSFFPQNITDVTPIPGSGKVFYLLPTTQEVVGYLSGTAGDKRSAVFSSPVKEWLPISIDTQTILLTTKPSATVAGVSYLLNTQTGRKEKILSNINGLTTLVSPDKKYALYSTSSNGGVSSKVLEIKTGEVFDIEIKTLPEKCVWSTKKGEHVVFCGVPESLPVRSYPDYWYMGLVSFSDALWKYDIDTTINELIAAPGKFPKEGVDVTRPFTTTANDYLLFTNKKDLSLWSVRVSE